MAKRKQETKPKPKLTPEQAAVVVEGWVMPFFNDDAEIGDFLLLVRTLAYEADATERENILIAVENVLLPFSRSVGDAVDLLIARRAEEASKGEAVN